MQFQIFSILPTQEYHLQKRGFSEFSSNHAPVPSWGTCFSIRGKIVGRKADDEADLLFCPGWAPLEKMMES